MKDISQDIQRLLEKYDYDTKEIIKNHSQLPYLYALAEMRENILEWYEFEPGASLLEVGGGYGALTGLFARRVAEVVVLDPSVGNVNVNRSRHESRGNIRYETGDLPGWDTEERFNYVVTIGTVAPPFEERIAKAKSLLKPGGKLIAAVCNTFGMKYWAGTPKDEVHFSRPEFERLMEAGGSCEWYYPMPDYKLPVTIYSQEYLPGKGELGSAVIAYDYPKYLKLDVGEMYDAVCGDGQFEYFANSFLIIWSGHEKD